MVRKLQKIEKIQVNLAKKYHENVLKNEFKNKPMIVLILIEIILIIMTVTGNYSWFTILFMVIIPFPIWLMIRDFKYNRIESKKILSTIKSLQHSGQISISNYKSNRALKFLSYDDEELLFIIQIEENKSIAIVQYEFDYSLDLPNSEFELYNNEHEAKIFGNEIKPLGNHFQPTIISGNIKSIVYDSLPKHKEIINMGIEDFLIKLEIENQT